MLKTKNLAFQIWFAFTLMIVGICLLLLLFLPFTLHSFFTDDVYTRIEDMQERAPFEKNDHFPPPNEEKRGDERFHIQTIVLFSTKKETHTQPLPPVKERISPLYLAEIKEQAKNQKEEKKRYEKQIGKGKILYVIKKEKNETILTYVRSDFRNDLAEDMLTRILSIIGFVLILSIPMSIYLAKLLAKPLVQIENHVKNIAERKWDEPLILHRNDEMGKLASSVERLRKRLIKQDEKQQFFLQNVSHELKTPVMIIRSYMESIRDGVYPKGDLTGSLDVIDGETLRLEGKIKDLLYLTKLNYLAEEKVDYETFQLDVLLEDVVEKFRYERKDVQWHIQVDPLSMTGDPEQIIILFENLIQNQIRYAIHEIGITCRANQQGQLSIVIENDGEHIEADDPMLIFESFYKGKNGQFGLGLAIAKYIVDLHKGSIHVKNKEKGVQFSLFFPSHAFVNG